MSIETYKNTALIVEDEAIIAMSLKQKLILNGINVVGNVPSGEQALNFLENIIPDFILMDILLSGIMDGINTALEIKKKYSIPIIFISAHSDSQTFKRAKEVDPYGFILKPINEKELFNTIELALYKFNLEKQAHLHEQMYRDLFNNMYSCVIVYKAVNYGENFIIIDLNNNVEKIENVRREEIINKTVTEIFPGVIDFGLFDIFKDVYKTGETRRLPVSFYSDNRIAGWRDNIVYKLPTDEIVAVYLDISREKQIEEEIKIINHELANTNEELRATVSELEAANEELVSTNEEFEQANEELLHTQKQLEESNQQYQNFFQHMIDAYALQEMLYDENGRSYDCRFIDINTAFEEFTGLSRDIIGKTIRDILQDEASEWVEFFSKVVETGHSVYFEHYFNSVGKWVEIKAYLAEKNIFGTFIIDISERKKVVKQLQESEERFRNTFEQAAVGIAHLDLEGKFLRINKRFCDILGYTPQEMMEKSFKDITHKDYLKLSLENFHKALSGEVESFTMEKLYYNKKGDIVWANTTVSTLRNDNELKYFIAVIEDITHRKKIESSLSKHEAAIKTIQNGVSAKIGEQFFESVVSKVLDVLNAYSIFIGQVSAGGENLIQTVIYCVENEKKENKNFDISGTPYEEVISQQKSLYEMEMRKKYPNTTFFHTMEIESFVGVPVFDSNKQIIGLIAALFQDKVEDPDIAMAILQIFSTRIGAEIERLSIENKVNQSLVEKEILLKEIHHRVKNNMQIISSLLNLQTFDIYDERDKAFFIDSQNRIRTMALVHERLYKSDTFSEIDFNTFIQELISEYSHTYPHAPLVTFKVDIDDIELTLEDAVPCALLINELITNSLKHAFPAGSRGVISISFKKDKNIKKLTVADNGKGLPSDFNIEKSTSLGMSLVHSLSRQLNTALSYKIIKGTSFSFTFK